MPHSSPFQVSATMHELQVTPLLMHKGSKSRHHQRLKRGSQSFDECGEDYRGRVTSHHKPSRAYKRQRSNPNILDLIPPPPPLCAPPSLPTPDYPPYDLDQRPGSSKPHRTAAFKIQHIKDRRDSDTSEYFTQVREEDNDNVLSSHLSINVLTTPQLAHMWTLRKQSIVKSHNFCFKCFLKPQSFALLPFSSRLCSGSILDPGF